MQSGPLAVALIDYLLWGRRDSLRAPERDALKAAERLKGADHDRAGPLPGRPRPIKSVPDMHQRGFPLEATQVRWAPPRNSTPSLK
jgi:hypothetical protein